MPALAAAGSPLSSEQLQELVEVSQPDVQPVNAIQMELEHFARSIINDEEPPVTVLDGFHAIKLAHEILAKIEKNTINK